MRWVGRLFALVGFLLFVAVGALGLAAYLAASGRDLRVLDRVVRSFGNVVADQRTERLVLDVTVEPDEGLLTGRAHLTVKPIVEGRRRFYFLLGDAFGLTAFSAPEYPEARAYKLWLITVVDLGRVAPANVPFEIALDYEGRPTAGLFGLGTAKMSPRDVQLSVDSFWFPNDLQGQFDAEVAVTLPGYLTVVHAGDEIEHSSRGSMQRVRWRYARPVPSLSLVAGPYRVFDLDDGEVGYRVYLADDVKLDADRILKMAADANGLLTDRYGPSGYSRLSYFVSRKLRRAYNDGAGVMGLSIRYFRRGDYGFNVVAHETAHNWFGATVMEKWLKPATGGEWLVEGFAEMSSLVAVEEQYGREALVRRLAGNFFDPRRDGVVGNMSVLDNGIGPDSARETIYSKGSWVAMMLRHVVGDEAFFAGMRKFIDTYRYQSATEAELETVLQQESSVDLSAFFSQWVRSDHGLDLAVEENASGLILNNVGANTAVAAVDVAGATAPAASAPAAVLPGDAPVAESPPAEGAPDAPAVADPDPTPAAGTPGFDVGATLSRPATNASLNADPDLVWADMWRDNNLFPRTRYPLVLEVGASATAEVDGLAFPWSGATLKTRNPEGAALGSWELPATVVSWPRWLDEHVLVLNTTDTLQTSPAVALFDTRNGETKIIGRGTGPDVSAGAIYAAHGDSIVRWQSPAWKREVVTRQKRRVFGAVTPSPDGARLAYVVARDNDMDIRVLSLADRRETTLLSWDRDLRDLVWSADGTRIYVGIGGDWDWQVWEIPIESGEVRILAREAAALGSLALSPDGGRLAFAAAPQLDYPYNRREIIVLGLTDQAVNRIAVGGSDVRQVVWLDDATILAVAAPAAAETPFTLPDPRMALRIDVAGGSVAPY